MGEGTPRAVCCSKLLHLHASFSASDCEPTVDADIDWKKAFLVIKLTLAMVIAKTNEATRANLI